MADGDAIDSDKGVSGGGAKRPREVENVLDCG